jgi:transcriptional regulator with XRE-family HTH domain
MDHVSKAFETASFLHDGRLAKGYSLEDLAIATGLTVDEIEAAERGDQVPEHNIERIEHALR